MIRVIAMALALTGSTVVAHADCASPPLGEPEGVFFADLSTRMARTGEAGAVSVGKRGDMDAFLFETSPVSMYLTSGDGMLSNVDTVLSSPFSAVDADRQLTLAAFTLARYSGEKELVIKTQIARDMKARPAPSVWTETFGDAVAVVTRKPDAIVFKMGKAGCSP